MTEHGSAHTHKRIKNDNGFQQRLVKNNIIFVKSEGKKKHPAKVELLWPILWPLDAKN